MEVPGVDSEGREFKSASEMWREEVGDEFKKSDWYRKGVSYWQGVEATVDGVLGGYAHVSHADIKASEAFLRALLSERFPNVGRDRQLVALGMVDLLEPVSHFLESARVNLSAENLTDSEAHKAANFYCFALQDFTPNGARYDCIWIQWCIGHLADDDLVSFFQRAKGGLKPGGFFVLKENIARKGFVLDNEDKSVTRSDSYFKELFNQSGLYVYKMQDQKGFPDELFAVKMYALVPELPKRVTRSKNKRLNSRPGSIK